MNSRQRARRASPGTARPLPFVEGDVFGHRAFPAWQGGLRARRGQRSHGAGQPLALFRRPSSSSITSRTASTTWPRPCCTRRPGQARPARHRRPGPLPLPRRWCAATQGRYAVAAKMRMGVSPTLLSMGLDNFACLADDPGLVDTIVGRYADWSIAILGRLREVGVDFVWTMDDMAYRAGPMFSPRARQVFMPHMRRVAAIRHGPALDLPLRRQRDALSRRPAHAGLRRPAPD